MAAQLTFEYDVLGDVMYIEKCRPYASQESDDLECGVVARLHPATEEIESLEIIFYSTRILRRNPVQLEIPVAAGRIFDQPAAAEFDCLAQTRIHLAHHPAGCPNHRAVYPPAVGNHIGSRTGNAGSSSGAGLTLPVLATPVLSDTIPPGARAPNQPIARPQGAASKEHTAMEGKVQLEITYCVP